MCGSRENRMKNGRAEIAIKAVSYLAVSDQLSAFSYFELQIRHLKSQMAES
jgi:hypothetical protein